MQNELVTQTPIFLDLKSAANYTGLKPRWLRRYWTRLRHEGVKILKLPTPTDPDKGKIMINTSSLIEWMEKHQIKEPPPRASDGSFAG